MSALGQLYNCVSKYGFDTPLTTLVHNAYWRMKSLGFNVRIANGQYLEINGTTYFFSKCRQTGCWIAKEI